ncbi:MAG: sensor domain-containing diguanylate cyclase [Acidimicrobiales bacterium]
MGFDTTATQLRGVLSFARKVTSIEDEQELLDFVCLTARERLGYTACILSLRGEGGIFRLAAASGVASDVEASLRALEVPTEAFEALTHAALQSSRVCYVPADHPVRDREDVSASILPTGVSVPSRSWRKGSLLFVPLVASDGEPIGFLNPDDPLSGELPSIEQAMLLEILADLTVVGLEFVRVRTVERSTLAMVQAQRGQLEALMMASAQVGGGLLLDEVLKEIAMAMTSSGGFERAAIYLLCDDEHLECRATVGLTAEEADQLSNSPLSLSEFSPAMRPEMQISRSFLFDHCRHALPDVLNEKLNVPCVERDWKEGQWHPEDMLTVPLVDKEGVLLGIITLDESSNGLLPDHAHIAALEFFADQCATAVVHARRFEAVQAEAQTDPLTGLANRRALEDVVEQSVNRYENFGEPSTLLFIDIDHFKEVNDTFGHAIGDIVLQRVGTALRDRLRRGDLLARYGGEEFVALLPDSSIEAGKALGESLRDRIELMDFTDLCGDIPIRVSVGVASVTSDRLDADSLLAAADAAMYQAKRDGRNRVCASA